MVGELKATYVEKLDDHGIVWSTHVSRFVEFLLARVQGLLKGLSGNKLSVFFDSVVQNNTQITQDFFESLVNIVGPIRHAGFKFCKACQNESVPIEHPILVNFILEGIDFSENGFSKESLALDQIMMFNFRFNRVRREIVKEEDASPIKETLFPFTLL